MLVLQRNKSQEVIIRTPSGEVIRVVVVDASGRSPVRLGFEASAGVSIHRKEIDERVQAGKARPATEATP